MKKHGEQIHFTGPDLFLLTQFSKISIIYLNAVMIYCSGWTVFPVPNISSSRPWTKAPQAPEAMRLTVLVSSFSLGASSAHFLPEENSPEAKSSLARSCAVRFLWTQIRGGKDSRLMCARYHYCTFSLLFFFFFLLTLRSDISFLSKVCSRN